MRLPFVPVPGAAVLPGRCCSSGLRGGRGGVVQPGASQTASLPGDENPPPSLSPRLLAQPPVPRGPALRQLWAWQRALPALSAVHADMEQTGPLGPSGALALTVSSAGRGVAGGSGSELFLSDVESACFSPRGGQQEPACRTREGAGGSGRLRLQMGCRTSWPGGGVSGPPTIPPVWKQPWVWAGQPCCPSQGPAGPTCASRLRGRPLLLHGAGPSQRCALEP